MVVRREARRLIKMASHITACRGGADTGVMNPPAACSLNAGPRADLPSHENHTESPPPRAALLRTTMAGLAASALAAAFSPAAQALEPASDAKQQTRRRRAWTCAP